jgi:hypothetical protein
MSWFPSDLPSFLWGVAVAVPGLIATGFFREAGKELWIRFRNRYFPEPSPPPEPVQVDQSFQPTQYRSEDCVWARHESVSRLEGEGYTYYLHPKNGAKCVRGYGQESSFLMVKPNAHAQTKT